MTTQDSETPSQRPVTSSSRKERRRRNAAETLPQVGRKAELYGAGAVAVIAFFVYLRTLSPGLHFGDGPEFAAAAHILGVPHPTGYPLYMLLLKLWATLLPLGDVIVRTSLFSAACLSAASAIAVLILLSCLRTLLPNWSDKSRLVAACSGAWAGAFLRFHWNNAVVTEVYALQFLLTLVFLRALQKHFTAPSPSSLLTASACFGLGLANHRMSIFLALPLLLAWGGTIRTRALISYRKPLLVSLLLIGGGLSLYAYLPIRASARPAINWGDPSSLSRFLEHVRGGEFVEQRFLRPIPSNPNARFTAHSYLRFAIHESGQILTDLAGQLVPLREVQTINRSMQRVFVGTTPAGSLPVLVLLALAGIGIWKMTRSLPLFSAVALLVAVQNLLLLFLYNILDLRDYYLFPFWFLWVAAYVGLLWGIELALARRRTSVGEGSSPAVYLLLLIPLVPLVSNWGRCDRSSSDAAERMGQLLLPESKEIMPEGSLLLTAADADLFPAWYNQLVRRQRPDVLLVGSNFLREPWYQAHFTPEQIQRYHLKFSGTIPHGPEGFVQQLAEGVIDANLPQRAVFTTTIQDIPTLQAMSQRYRLAAVAQVPIALSHEYPEETTAALLRILPKETTK